MCCGCLPVWVGFLSGNEVFVFWDDPPKPKLSHWAICCQYTTTFTRHTWSPVSVYEEPEFDDIIVSYMGPFESYVAAEIFCNSQNEVPARKPRSG